MRSGPEPRFSTLAAVLLLVTASWPLGAKAGCDREQLAAEAALRRHTEIMVASLLCESHPTSLRGTQSPYALYRVFTARHNRIIGGWEQQIAARSGLEQFDFWRTELANEVVRADLRRASVIGTDAYCAEAKRVLETAMRLSSQEVQAFATPGGSASVACAWVQTSERVR